MEISHLYIAAALLAVAVVTVLQAWLARRAARRFGCEFELVWLRKALHDLQAPGRRLVPNVPVPGLGDVDLMIEHLDKDGRVAQRVVVEIKSFIIWNVWFFGMFLGQRERAAVAQVERLRQRLKADRCVVWLPQGRMSLWQRLFGHPRRHNVHILAGGTRRLARFLDT